MKSNYGRHLSYPFRIAQDGRTSQVASLGEHVREELIQLLLTNLGERAFLPEFGGGIRRLVFEPLDEATQGMTKTLITQAISNWLGHRITLENLKVVIEDSKIEIEVSYRVTATGESKVMKFQRTGEQL
jgi:phage baseplate assembly protein W